MNGVLRDAIEGFLDLVYPPKCLSCGEFGPDYLCEVCISRIEPVPEPFCKRCGHPLLSPECVNCQDRPRSFSRARAAGEYAGVLREAIHQFKYGGHRELAAPLASLLYSYLCSSKCNLRWKSAHVLVPVPIHRTRRRLRGYNQSDLLVRELSVLTGIPVVSDAVERMVVTHPQVELSRQERKENVKGAFRVTLPESVSGRTILLVDDVATTSSTVHECSLALRDAGAAKVMVLCLAFGS